jgi:hypothetical protein
VPGVLFYLLVSLFIYLIIYLCIYLFMYTTFITIISIIIINVINIIIIIFISNIIVMMSTITWQLFPVSRAHVSWKLSAESFLRYAAQYRRPRPPVHSKT